MDLAYPVIWIGLALLAAYLAHKKKRSWVGAMLLTLIAPPIGILAALLVSPDPSTGQPSLVRAKILVGLFPLWAAIGAVVIGSYTSNSPDYWNVAPWLIVAAVPVCILTLFLVEIFARKKIS